MFSLNTIPLKTRSTLEKFTRPVDIQAFLDSIVYDGADVNRTVDEVVEQQSAHCLDGGIFGALALRYLGYQPLIIDLVPAPKTDDDHVLAIFKRHGCWGAVAKSNYVGLRYREPIHRNLRELVMTYFEVFYSITGQRTLRAYTRPLDLSHYDHLQWWEQKPGLDVVINRLYSLKSIPLLKPEVIPELTRVDKRSYDAGMLGINMDGVYRPEDESLPPVSS
jgi:hypothetical protein